jgi:tripartite-type tricarboxylate transporter receptor subunit TctC
VLFVGGSQRFAKMNSVPTAAEINMPMPYVGSWGAVLPKNISKDIVDFYVSLFKKIASDPRFVNDINGIESFAQSDKMGPADMRESYNKHLKLFEKYKNIN